MKKICRILVLLLLFFLLTGCGNGSSDLDAEEPPKEIENADSADNEETSFVVEGIDTAERITIVSSVFKTSKA